MRQAILLERLDLDALRRGIGLSLNLGGETVTLLYAAQTIRLATRNGHVAVRHAATNGHAPPPKAKRKMTPARRAAFKKMLAAAHTPAARKKRTASIRAAFKRKREEAANAQ
jgi:hypothetical protein